MMSLYFGHVELVVWPAAQLDPFQTPRHVALRLRKRKELDALHLRFILLSTVRR